MKHLSVIIFSLIYSFLYSQDSLKSSFFEFGLELGIVYLNSYDLSHSFASNIETIDNRTVPHYNVNFKMNFFKNKKYIPSLQLGISSFSSKASNIQTYSYQKVTSFFNRYFLINSTLAIKEKVNIAKRNFIFNYGLHGEKLMWMQNKSSLLDGTESTQYSSIGIKYRKNSNLIFGTMLGLSYDLGKTHIGLYYYQRLFFYGFNREISRLVLRASI